MSTIPLEEITEQSAIEPYSKSGALSAPESEAISAPITQSGLNHFFLNFFVPGTGSIAHGKKTIGTLQLLLALGGSLSCFLFSWYALFIVFLAYAWSIITGLTFLKGKDGPLQWK